MSIYHRRQFFKTNTLVVSIIAAMALTMVSCRGSSPEQQQQGQNAPAVSASGVSVEWTETDLETDTSRIGYGANPKGILARKDGALVFTPETPRDHIASRFIELPASDAGHELELVLDVKSPGGDACEASLQDQAYNMLVTVPCRTVGEHKASAKVSGGVRTVRLYFQSPQKAQMKLPSRVRLVEHR